MYNGIVMYAKVKKKLNKSAKKKTINYELIHIVLQKFLMMLKQT